MCQIGILADGLSVDGGDNIAYLHLAAGLAERTVLENIGNPDALSSLSEVVEQSELRRCVALSLRTEPTTRMAHVQLTQQFAQEFGKVVIVGDMG